MKLKGKQAKRKGTGLSESDIICSACYQNVRKKFLTTNYSPCKPVKPRLSSDGKQSDGGDVASSSKSATSDTSSIVYIYNDWPAEMVLCLLQGTILPFSGT